MIWKLIRWSRQLRILLGGSKKREEKFFLFRLDPPLSPLEFRKRLISLCFQYNPFSHTFRDQIVTLRKLDPDAIHQYHLRYYGDGVVTGHYEIDWFADEKAHNKSVDLRKLTKSEIAEIREALK